MPGDATRPPGEAVVEELEDRLPERTPFLEKVRDEFRRYDLPVVALVPVVLVLLFQLSLETRLALGFDYADPTILTAFTANYVHFTAIHLLSNVAAYLALVTVGYLLALTTGDRTRFYSALAVAVLVLPSALSYIDLVAFRSGIGMGFSGSNAVLFGYVLVELADYLEEHFTDHFGVENAPALFFLVTSFVAFPHVESALGLSVAVGSVLLAGAYLGGFVASYRPSLAAVRDGVGKQGYFELVVVVGVLGVGYLPFAFPQNPVHGSGIVNVYTHLIGFCLGFVAAYAWVLVTTPADPAEAVPIDG